MQASIYSHDCCHTKESIYRLIFLNRWPNHRYYKLLLSAFCGNIFSTFILSLHNWRTYFSVCFTRKSSVCEQWRGFSREQLRISAARISTYVRHRNVMSAVFQVDFTDLTLHHLPCRCLWYCCVRPYFLYVSYGSWSDALRLLVLRPSRVLLCGNLRFDIIPSKN